MKSIIPSLDWLSDPRVFAVNREAAHSDHRFYTSPEQAARESSMPLKQSLNGRWKFAFSENPGARPCDFFHEDYDYAGWSTIEVPGHIQLQGWDKCQYINTMYPWDGHSELRPPEVSADYNPVGSYVKEFVLNPELRGKRVYLSFQGVETALYVWVNGQFVGYGEDAFTPSEFEITQLLRSGSNRIAVEVYKRSSASWIEDQDFWRFSGIFREVYLYAVPKAHIRDLFVTTDLSEDYESAAVNARMKLQLETKGVVYADAILRDAEGQTVASLSHILCSGLTAFSLPVSIPCLWSAEEPYLYHLLISLTGEDGTVIEAVPQTVGIREFKLKNGVMLINGKRILFKGINRHEFNCRTGRAITREDMLWDIRFFKQNNINAVRTSHYPNQSEWYRLCDEYGIYLMDEANLESHGSWQKMGAVKPDWVVPGDREDWLDAVIDRAASMLERDKNHPSVLIWSCGNESFGGLDIFKMSQYFHQSDPSRLVHYEGVFHDRRYNDTSDMESRMYAKPQEIEEYLKNDPEKPFVSCEYMHAMGNSCGGMHLYTELEKHPKYQGGFIWDYIDQAILAKDENGSEVLCYGGDFDDRATDYNFCTDGIVYAQREPSPKVQEVKFLYQAVKLIPDKKGVLVKNRNLFSGTEDFYVQYELLQNGNPIYSARKECSVNAGEEKYFHLALPEILQSGEYALSCSLRHKNACSWAEQDFEQAFGQYVWTAAGEPEPAAPELPLTVVHGDVNIGVHGGGVSVLFSLQEGGIVSLRRNGTEFITRPPKPIYWRAATDNDRGNGYAFRTAVWNTAGLFQKCRNVFVDETKGVVTVTYEYELPVPVSSIVTLSYTVRPNGSILVEATYPGVQSMPELPLFGVGMRLTSKYCNFTYYGMGPDENYCDRVHGARLGVFKGTAQKNLSQYIIPQECGNRTGVRWATVTDDAGTGLCFTACNSPFEFGLLPYTAYELENALHREELPPPRYTAVRILAKQMGIGGDDSWGAPVHEEYMIPSDKPLKLAFTIDICG